MRYYDIHTHQAPVYPEDTTILNVSVGVGQDLDLHSVDDGLGEVPLSRSYGIHPWYIYNVQEQMDQLRHLVARPRVVAIGEAGLDKLAATSLRGQEAVFMEQVNLAEEMGKPLIVHCVKAWPELIACRKSACPKQPWIIHGFRGNGELAAQLLQQGLFLSFGEHFHPSAVRAAWPYSLFAETDDKPTDIRTVYRSLSRSLSIPERELAAQIEKNVYIFHIGQ